MHHIGVGGKVQNKVWTDALCARVKVLWLTHSARQTAKVLSDETGHIFSRNAIIGIVHRLRLNADDRTVVPRKKPKRSEAEYATRQANRIKLRLVSAAGNGAQRSVRTVEFTQPKLRCVELPIRNIRLVDLEPNDCRYIPGEDYLFCGLPQREGSSFCPEHHDLCRNPPKPVSDKYTKLVAA
jgi:GcrA cell cycle regulator